MKDIFSKVFSFIKANSQIILAAVGLLVLVFLGSYGLFEFLKFIDNPLSDIQSSLWVLIAVFVLISIYRMNNSISKQNQILEKISQKISISSNSSSKSKSGGKNSK